MKRVERHIILKDKNLEDLCHKSKNLYNYVNYILRQSFIKKEKFIEEYELVGKLGRENQIDFRALPSGVSQQIIFLLYKNLKSFFKAVKDYKTNPKKYKTNPKLPGYKKKDGLNILIFTANNVIRLKDEFIYFPKKTNIQPLKTKIQGKLKQVRIIPKPTCFVIEVIYDKEIQDLKLEKNNFLSIDLGLNNLATSINNVGLNPFIINGKPIKSINQFYNKRTAELKSKLEKNQYQSKNIKKLSFKRNNKVQDYLHKTSRFIINYCKQNNIGTIIIGKNNNWKQDMNLGKRNNQNFVNIPFNKLIEQIQYKAEELGIEVKLTEESYTSKIDHLAFETLQKQEVYLGKRIKRGLFQSSTGKLINADVNGSIGIARKVVGDFDINQIINRGLAYNPVRISS